MDFMDEYWEYKKAFEALKAEVLKAHGRMAGYDAEDMCDRDRLGILRGFAMAQEASLSGARTPAELLAAVDSA